MKEFYQEQQSLVQKEIDEISKKLSRFSLLRLLIFVGTITCFYLIEDRLYFSLSLLILAASFLWIVRIYFKLKTEKLRLESRAEVLKNELEYLTSNVYPEVSPCPIVLNGHFYAQDIDVFGDFSLYRNINRAQSGTGRKLLATWLSEKANLEAIVTRQNNIKELGKKHLFRIKLQSLGRLSKDQGEHQKSLENWLNAPGEVPKLNRLLSYALPGLGAISTIVFVLTENSLFFQLGILLFTLNLSSVSKIAKNILKQLGNLERLDKQFQSYSEILGLISKEDFTSEKLVQMNNKAGEGAREFKELAAIFSQLESIRNGFGMLVFNGFLQFHLHAYVRMIRWCAKNKENVGQWIDLIAEMESLSSLATFHANHNDYVFPEINKEYHFLFESLTHPLIHPDKAIGNSLNLSEKSFVILTGSNMSGKSTFLRTLGLSLCLANAGSVVPAKNFQFTPIQLLCCIRLNDNLAEETSYFYAEVKRLKAILEGLKKEKSFVLMDEILRGTNSEDKVFGSSEVVKSMVRENAFGLIATHDLQLCELVNEFPTQLQNQCFEAKIENDNLLFDYQMRDGICKNKSASFLLEREGVI